MSDTPKRKSRKDQSSTAQRGDTYHGVRIPEPYGTSRFSKAELKRAVEIAIAKNRHLFTPRKG